MSLYSTTDTNINTPTSSDFLDYRKLSKFNKFYFSKTNYLSKFLPGNTLSLKHPPYKKNLFISATPSSPTKLTRVHTGMNMNLTRNNYFINSPKSKKIKISTKIKNKFNPDILDTRYISQPKKFKKKIPILYIPKCNTFLAKKIKTKSLNLNKFDLIGRNKRLIISPSFINKPIFNKSFRDIIIKNKIYYNKNDSFSHSMKMLIERANKNSKKASDFMGKTFKQKLNYDRRENLHEYNKFISELKTSLNLSKSKSKIQRLVFDK